MSGSDFKAQVKQGLKKLNRKQQVLFAWRCAMRALPFLGRSGNFDFWDKEKIVKYFYGVFYALDCVAIYDTARVAYTDLSPTANTAANAAYAAASRVAYTGLSPIAYAAANAARAAANAANTTNTTKTANATAYAAASAASAASNAARECGFNIEPFILQELNGENCPISINFYGEVWPNFQKALEKEGCAYWGKLFQTIFENNFQLDQAALQQRLSVPREIKAQGAVEVAIYLQALEEKGAKQLNEARIIILGDKGAGKTCLARRLIDPDAPMTTDDESTAGVDTTLWTMEEDYHVNIWDFAGHTVTHAVHQFFLSERCLYLLVYNGRSEEKGSLEYWLDHMQNYGGDSKAMILVNKRDQHRVDIKANYLKKKYPIAGVYYFSIEKDKDDLDAFRQAVAQHIKTNPSWKSQLIPENYYQVKSELETLFSKHKEESISRNRFDEIANKHQVVDKEHLLTSLHQLGISLWYPDMEDFNTLVLNPEWISHGVYKIINWVNEAKQYSLTLADFSKVFQADAERYPTEQHRFLFQLMQRYELAYQTDGEEQLIIPHLLNEDCPEELPLFSKNDLKLKYEANQPLPPHTISRFIVRHNQQIQTDSKESSVWRYGVILQDGRGSLALVQEEDREISVSVSGADKSNYIAALRESLNDIFDSYKSDKPELQYKVMPDVNIAVESNRENPELWMNEQRILNLFKANMPHFEDVSGTNVTMNLTVHNYLMHDNSRVMQAEVMDNSTHNTFNFYDCNIDLQGNLNELADLLDEVGNSEEAETLKNTTNALEKLEQCKTPEEVKKKGLANRLKRLVEDLNNEDSNLRKAVDGVEKGIDVAQDIAKRYNSIAEWAGLPQVPTAFL